MIGKKTVMTLGAVAAVAVATPTIGGWEGLETKPYKDIGGVWTVCYGETHVEMREYTKEECDNLLAARVPDYYNSAMEHVVDVEDVPITMRAAITSFNYNVGPTNFKNSTMLKLINRKEYWNACQELDKWVYVARMRIRGLENRRAAEKRLCVAELKEEL